MWCEMVGDRHLLLKLIKICWAQKIYTLQAIHFRNKEIYNKHSKSNGFQRDEIYV